MRRRKVLARSVRSVVEKLESRTFLSATLAEGAGTASISGIVYDDMNGNGVQDAGEPIAAGISVSLAEVGVSYPAGTTPTVQTDVNGNFSFTALAAGQYTVKIVPDTGLVQDAPGVVDITVSAGATASYNVGETNSPNGGGSGAVSISGTVFNDVSQNGVYNPATDQFLAGDTVYLDLNGSGVQTVNDPQTTTDTNGQYSFASVQAVQSLTFAYNTLGGTFVLDFSDANASPALATTATAPITFDATNAGDDNTIAIQNAINAIDPNGGVLVTDGIDAFHYNVTYKLTGPQAAIATDPATALILSPPASASLVVNNMQTGILTTPTTPGQPSIQQVSFGYMTSGGGFELGVADGQATPPVTTTLTTFISFDPTNTFNDTANGIRNAIDAVDPNGGVTVVEGADPFNYTVTYLLDGPQAPLTGVSTNLTTAASPLSDTSVQAGSGPINPGVYEVRVIPRPGFHQDPPGYAQATVYSDLPAVINVGENNRATISGVVFGDLNGNGVQDPGEGPVAGETVFLDLGQNGKLQATTAGIAQSATAGSITLQAGSLPIAIGDYVQITSGTGVGEIDAVTGYNAGSNVATVAAAWIVVPDASSRYSIYTDPLSMTNANGQYAFTGLNPGSYRVEIMSASGMIMDNPQYADANLAAGQDVVLNLGEGLPASVSGIVFDDKNANGIQDPGEPGVPNQAVFLDVNTDGVLEGNPVGTDGKPLWYAEPNTVSGSDGSYSLTGLAPGTYTLRQVTPNGAVATAPGTPSHGFTFTLGSGTNLTNQNFGFETPDLTITNVSFPTKPALAGVPLKATVRIMNVGSLTAKGLAGINLWAQTTNTGLDLTIATLVGTVGGKQVHLAPGQTRLLNVNFEYPEFPTELPTGLYFIYAQVVSTVHDNYSPNDITSPIGPVQVTAPFIDLSAAYVVQPPASVAPGQSTDLEVAVTNSGNVASTGELALRVYVTENPLLEPTDSPVVTFTFENVRIKAGKTRIFRVTLPNPKPSLGLRYVLAYVDSGDALGEANLTNNLATPIGTTLFD